MCVRVGKRERERERGGGGVRETDRQTDRQTEEGGGREEGRKGECVSVFELTTEARLLKPRVLSVRV